MTSRECEGHHGPTIDLVARGLALMATAVCLVAREALQGGDSKRGKAPRGRPLPPQSAPPPMSRPVPVMRRPAGQYAHPLLVDQVVYVQRGRTDAETNRRIADACEVSGIDPARAVACIAAPAGPKREAAKGRGRGRPRKAASGPDFEQHAPAAQIHPHSTTPPSDHGKATQDRAA